MLIMLQESMKLFRSHIASQCFTSRLPMRWKVSMASQATVEIDQATRPENAKPFSSIPGPLCLPLIGTAWDTLPFIGHGFQAKKLHERGFRHLKDFGPIWKLRFPPLPHIVFLTDPHDIETMFRVEGKVPIRHMLRSLKHYRTVTRKESYDNPGIVLASGEQWYKVRSQVQQSLMKPQSIYMYIHQMTQVCDDFITRIRFIRNEDGEVPSDFQNELYKFSLEAISCVALDTRLGCLDQHLAPDSAPQLLINAVFETFSAFSYLEPRPPYWRLFPTPSWRRLVKAQDTCTEICCKYIQTALDRIEKQRRDDDADPTVLEMLLSNEKLTQQEVLTMITDMLIAGIDTTGNCLGFTLYHLAKNPAIQARLKEEVQKVLPNKDDSITHKELDQLRYLKACIRESLRMTPVAAGIFREMPKDVIIGGYHIPKGKWVVALTHVSAMREENFSNPEKFDPSRWLRGTGDKAHPFAALPFGYGPRMCIGRRLSEQEMWLLLAKVIQNFWIEYHHEDISIESRFIFSPDKPLRFSFLEAS